jgi:hypothetical protein
MINKPVNAYPYNVCVNANESFNIEYELPNNSSINGAYMSIKDLQGKELWSDYQLLNGETIVHSSVPSNINTNGEDELSWNSFYWSGIEAGTYSATMLDVGEDGQISVIPSSNESYRFISIETMHPKKYNGFNLEDKHGNRLYSEVQNNFIFGMDLSDYYDGKVYEKYSSLTKSEADELIQSGCSCYCLREPTSEVRSYLENNKNSIKSPDFDFAICVNGLDGNTIFFGKISGYINLQLSEPVVGKGGSRGYSNVDYVAFIIEKSANWGWGSYESRSLTNVGGTTSNLYKYEVGKFPLISSISILWDFSLPCVANDYLYLNGKYRNIQSSTLNVGKCVITVEPGLAEEEINSLQPYQNLGFFKTTPENANTTQNFYFRYKSPPALSIVSTSEISTLSDGETEDTIVESTKQVNDVKCEFGIIYESQYKLNYFQLYLMGYDTTTNEWNLLSSSEMLNKATYTHTFDGLMDGNEYAVYCVCYDIDGDEWQSDEYRFVVSNPGETSNKIDSNFNQESMAVEISIQKLIHIYKNLHIDFYKEEMNTAIKPQLLKYAGGGYCKTCGENDAVNGLAIFDVFRDYNVRNNTEYQYYAKISYTGRNYDDDGNELLDDATSGTVWFKIPDTISTDFAGTSVMELSERYDNVYEITNEFKILYKRESHEDTINYELSRDYADTVGKYSYEIRGSQNYKTGECTGLLGHCLNGDYIEPALLSDKWQRFVNGDGIKLYRGLNGETLIISIESTKIAKPTYANARRVSDVTFTFREIADANNYVVYETELVEG